MSTAAEPSGTIHVLLDEAFEPLTAVGAVTLESAFFTMNDRIRDLYEDLRGDYYLRDLRSFEKFRKDGFHATADSYSVFERFINFLSKAVGFKAFILFSDGSRRQDLSGKKTVVLLYTELVRTILLKYRTRPLIVFHFEQHQDFNRYFQPIVELAWGQIHGRKSEVRVEIAKKMDPPTLAVVDYVVYIFAKWFCGNDNYAARTMSIQDQPWQHLRAVLRAVSLARSLEVGTIIRRGNVEAHDGRVAS